MRCAQCNEENAWTLARCWNCGAPLAASASQGTGVRGGAAPDRYGSSGAWEPSPAGPGTFAFDVRRWTAADQVTGGAALVFLVSLFLPWFGTDGGFFSVSVDGMWHGYMIVDLILAVVMLGWVVLLAGFGSPPPGIAPAVAGRLLTGAAALNLLLAAASFATKPVGTSWQYGAYIGLVAAIACAAAVVRSVMGARRA